jgi:hypothetical protein
VETVDLQSSQKDYAIFLPALSGFYATYVGKQRYGDYVDPARVPAGFTNSVESLNFLAPKGTAFHYPWALYSAGHATLDINKHAPKEDMIRNRDRSTSFMLGDSGGFQIAKGLWPGEWADPNCPRAAKQRELVLNWLEEYFDYGMILDIPTWTFRDPKASEACGIRSYEDAVNATRINNEYFMKNSKGRVKFLNVLQGGNHHEADDWYAMMKDYCDPTVYPDTHFNGWAMGGQNMCDVHLVLKRIVMLIHDGLLEQGLHDWMHFLGTSKLEWATLLTDIQRAVRKYHNPNFTISFDCASPFLATANGMIYTYNKFPDRGKWSYKMEPGVDDKKYSLDTRLLSDVLVNDIGLVFEEGPVSDKLSVKDICIYKPGDLNKIGKEGRTSWDSFSYCLQMGHNVWAHLNAVQTANEKYDAGIIPGMLVDDRHNEVFFRDLVDSIFSLKDREKSLQLIEDYSRYWMRIVGTRGFTGKKSMNSHTGFNNMFEVVNSSTVDEELESDQVELLASDVLEQLETQL